MTVTEVAGKAAEEVLRVIEREKAVIKAQIAEAIEKVLLTSQITPSHGWAAYCERPAVDRASLCGND